MGTRFLCLRTDQGEHAISKIGGDLIGVHRKRKLEGAAEAAVSAFEAVVLFAGNLTFPTLSRNLYPPVVHLYVHVVSAKARQFRGDDVLVSGFVNVYRWSPAGWRGRKAVQALLNGQQIANRIPSRKRHVRKFNIAIRYARETCRPYKQPV